MYLLFRLDKGQVGMLQLFQLVGQLVLDLLGHDMFSTRRVILNVGQEQVENRQLGKTTVVSASCGRDQPATPGQQVGTYRFLNLSALF